MLLREHHIFTSAHAPTASKDVHKSAGGIRDAGVMTPSCTREHRKVNERAVNGAGGAHDKNTTLVAKTTSNEEKVKTVLVATANTNSKGHSSTFFGAVVLAIFSAVERASGAMMASSPTTNNASHKRFGLPTSATRDPYRDDSDAVAYDPDPNLDANHHHHATPTRALRQRKIEPGGGNDDATTTTTTATATTSKARRQRRQRRLRRRRRDYKVVRTMTTAMRGQRQRR
ncbi:hypothetical protein EDB89DRAFT_1909649 [Lactarius sanguifluus]|nr:hypothetical protein EDB89DRAFT_1909649 [Lactarius sanguifluus]